MLWTNESEVWGCLDILRTFHILCFHTKAEPMRTPLLQHRVVLFQTSQIKSSAQIKHLRQQVCALILTTSINCACMKICMNLFSAQVQKGCIHPFLTDRHCTRTQQLGKLLLELGFINKCISPCTFPKVWQRRQLHRFTLVVWHFALHMLGWSF